MVFRRFALVLVLAATLAAGAAQAAAASVYPPGVPDLTDPKTQAEFYPLDMSRFDEDPDFPTIVLARVGEGSPQFLLMVVDARNGKDTWSILEDRAVFFVLFADRTTVQQAYLDEGFATTGKASGKFIAAGAEDVTGLMAKLRESHRRSRGPTRSRLSI